MRSAPPPANARIKLGEARLAVGDLERAVVINPRDHDLEVDLAWAHNVLSDHHSSLAHADRALAKKKDSAEAHCQRGEALRELGRHPEAVAAFTEAIRLKPGYETAYRERALAYAA